MNNVRFFLFLLFVFAIFFSCKKDSDTKTEKVFLYLLLCPNGIDSCYNDCANNNGISDGSITGVEYKNFESCKSQCDVYCNTSFLFIEN